MRVHAPVPWAQGSGFLVGFQVTLTQLEGGPHLGSCPPLLCKDVESVQAPGHRPIPATSSSHPSAQGWLLGSEFPELWRVEAQGERAPGSGWSAAPTFCGRRRSQPGLEPGLPESTVPLLPHPRCHSPCAGQRVPAGWQLPSPGEKS